MSEIMSWCAPCQEVQYFDKEWGESRNAKWVCKVCKDKKKLPPTGSDTASPKERNVIRELVGVYD